MKIIISHNQYNLIKESYRNEGVNAIIKYWKKELKKGWSDLKTCIFLTSSSVYAPSPQYTCCV